MSMSNLLAERGQCVERMREILNVAEKEGRDLNDSERNEYEAREARQSEIANLVARRESLAQVENAASEIVNEAPRLRPATEGRGDFRNASEYVSSFDVYARRGMNGCDARVLNALRIGTNSEGGFIVPQEFETKLTQALQDINAVRQWCNVISTSSQHNIPTESSLGSATWTAEGAAYTESDAAFGQVVLGAHKAATILKVSEELLNDAFFSVESYLAGNFGKRFGLLEEAAFVNGDGTGKPTGIVQGSSLGTTAAGANAITADELVDLYHSLGRPYRSGAVWLMNDATAKMIRKLKDGQSQYMWQPGLQAGQPDTLLGRPVIVSTAMPTVATGAKSVVFGDLSYYTVADRQGVAVQRLNELYAANGQVGFRAFKRTDGKVTLSAAIKHLAQA